jgi:hypothetical protein
MIEALKQQEKKGYISLILYIISIPLSFFFPVGSALIFAIVSVMWIIPDKNIEEAMKNISENEIEVRKH